MKQQFFILILFFFCFGATAQYANQISGNVSDSTTMKGISFATVSIVSANNRILKNSITDSFGNYLLRNIAPGNYKIVISAVGYARFNSNKFTVRNTTRF